MPKVTEKTPGDLLESILTPRSSRPLSQEEKTNQTLRLYLRQMVKTLVKKHQVVITNRYGLDGITPKTRAQTAEECAGLFKGSPNQVVSGETIRLSELKIKHILRDPNYPTQGIYASTRGLRKKLIGELKSHLELIRLNSSNEEFFKNLREETEKKKAK
jgi:hypothetical protein